MNTTLDAVRETDATAVSVVRRKPMRRRFALASAGLLAVLCAALGVNFAGDSSTSSTTVNTQGGVGVNTGSLQTWNVSLGSAGTVPAPASTDSIATINTSAVTASKIVISVYVTNLAALAHDYTSWNFDLGLYDDSATPVKVKSDTMTSDSGMVSWVVPVGSVKLFTLQLTGGSFYAIDNDTTDGSLAPQFFVRASEL